MKLRRRPKRKVEQALDALAGATRIWSDLQVGKRAGKSVGKAKRLRLPGALRSTPAKAIGAAGVVGAAGALVARKLKGDGPQEYSGPAPSVAAEAAASAPDAPPPVAVAPSPDPGSGPPAAGAAALRDKSDAANDDGGGATGDKPAVEDKAAGADASDKP